MNKQIEMQWFMGSIVLVLAYFLIVHTFPITTDYYYYYGYIPNKIMIGEYQLYDPDIIFGLLPWIIPFLALISQLPLIYGQSILTLLNAIGLVLGAKTFAQKSIDEQQRFYWWLLPIFTLHSFDLLIRTNLDGLVLLGITLVWIGLQRRRPLIMGVGMWLLTIKPFHLILFAVWILWGVRRWKPKELLLVIAPVGISFIASTVILGFQWIPNYISLMLMDASGEVDIMPTYLQTSLWRFLEYVGLPSDWGLSIMILSYIVGFAFVFTRKHVEANAIGIVIGLPIVFSTYAMGYHYVLLIPAFVILLQHHRNYAAIWLLTLTPLLRLYWSFNYVWLDSLYALTILICSIYLYYFSIRPNAPVHE